MDKSHFESFSSLFEEIYQGNEQAAEISLKLLKIANVWDDLVDKDNPVSEKDINNAFTASIFEIQNNPLWFQCGLNHHVLNVFLRWQDANSIEKDKEADNTDLIKCYMLRAGIYDIFVIISYYLFGSEWANKVGPIVRRFYGEDPYEFIEEIRQCQIQ